MVLSMTFARRYDGFFYCKLNRDGSCDSSSFSFFFRSLCYLLVSQISEFLSSNEMQYLL